MLIWLQTVFVHKAHFTQHFVEVHRTVFQNPEIWQNSQIQRLVPCAPLRRCSSRSLDSTAFRLVHVGPHEPSATPHHFPECSEPSTSQKSRQNHYIPLSIMGVWSLFHWPHLGNDRISCLNPFWPYRAGLSCQGWIFSLSIIFPLLSHPPNTAPKIKAPQEAIYLFKGTSNKGPKQYCTFHMFQ